MQIISWYNLPAVSISANAQKIICKSKIVLNFKFLNEFQILTEIFKLSNQEKKYENLFIAQIFDELMARRFYIEY